MSNPNRRINRAAENAIYGDAVARARVRRWTYPYPATVSHPDHGTVVVPCASSFAAILCAAEFWGVDEMEVLDATVMQYQDGDGPVRRPRDICKMLRGGLNGTSDDHR